MEMIGEFWSRGGEKFSGDTGEVIDQWKSPLFHFHLKKIFK